MHNVCFVTQKCPDPFFADRFQRLVECCLVGRKEIIPNCGRACFIDKFLFLHVQGTHLSWLGPQSAPRGSFLAPKVPSARGRTKHLLVPPFNGPEVRRRGSSYAGVELPQHRQTQLLDRLILDRVRQFGDVSEGHGSLGNWVLILGGIIQINQVIVGVIRHKLQCLGNGNASHRCCSRFRAFPFSKLQDVFDDAVGELAFLRSV